MSNIFYRNFSELSGHRYDPSTYHFERLEAIEKVEASIFDLKKLKYITQFSKNIVVENNTNLPYIGLKNVESNTGFYVKGTEKESFSSAVKFKKGQVLFPKLRPYLNKVYFTEFDGLCSTEFHVFDSSIIDNQYLSIFLQSNLVVAQTKYLMSGNTLPRLQRPALDYPALLSIPIIYDERIVQILEQAHQQKQQKEQEAKTKLESIDAYLLDALGIELPKDKNESLEDRVFFRKFSEVSGDRIDPKYNDYITKYKVILDKSVKLGSLLKRKPQYGANEIAIDYNEKCQYIRITDIDGFGELKKNGLKSAEVEEEKYQLVLNDILIARSGATVGKAYIHKDKKINAIFAGYMIRFKIDEKKINPKYVFYYMHSSIYKQWIEAIQRSAAQPNINAEEYQDLDIPILEKSMQDKIVKHITTLREEVETLKKEAAEFYDKAKLEVEKMILGEENVF